MPRPRSLTPEAIAAAALAVIDRDGLSALSMRTVATELGLTTMAVYRYVKDREQLERLVVDLVLGDLDVTPPARAKWQKQLTVLLDRARHAVSAHPGITPLTLAHRQSSDGVRRLGEAILSVLAHAGFSGHKRVIAFRALLSYLIGSLLTQHLGSLSGPGTASLEAQQLYPMLAETASMARSVSADLEFHGGLELILSGLEADQKRP
ncbi:TetR/AcrR family transcriptional regulator [Catelliglobosispora koreensis]|uniref:TetR/AcrR family transcriptional regulator n=1 Tax=Catelliglobosispora koreensis TaxID=129052 RepID=UPI000379BC81|nr:TetR/AcrR family transcriptional regulator C-terminal domain-containing protein [Catelliglobosispora koreensis]